MSGCPRRRGHAYCDTSFAERPSTPAELAETAKLNREIVDMNAAADELEQVLDEQYQEQKHQDDALQRQYQDQVASAKRKRNKTICCSSSTRKS